MKRKIGVHIPLALATTYFALFFFIFEDLGIRMIYIYILMFLLSVACVIFKPRIYHSNISLAYVLMSIVAAFFCSLPYSLHEYDVITVIISMLLCAMLSLLSKPSEKELNTMLKLIVIVALFISLYVIIVGIFPNIYIDYISKYISVEPRTNTIRMLRLKYGVMIGGNVTLVNHILVLSLLILINKYLIYGCKKGKSSAILIILTGLGAMLIENRKGELLAFILVAIYTFYFGGSIRLKEKKNKAIKYTFISIMVLTVLVIIALKLGLADRYLRFIYYFFTNNREEMYSGRLELWSIGIKLFKENPIIGIGWGNTRFHIDMFNTANQSYIYNVHCILLQLLAETGIIGCTMFMTPVLFIIIQMKRTVNQLRTRNNNYFLPQILGSVALEYQLFLLLNGMIDSTWQRISFWPFYAVSIIMGVAAQGMIHGVCSESLR